MAKRGIDMEKLKGVLLAEQHRLREKERRLDLRNASASEADEVSESADYDNHPADSATETESRTKDLALDENINILLGRIDMALRKIDDGSYGVCDRCAAPINPERLEAIPYATLCIDCQDIIEELG